MPQIHRASWHDYKSRCIYMVTIGKNPSVSDFGFLDGDFRLPPGTRGSSYIRASDTGRAIKRIISDFRLVEPSMRVLQYSLMPDHLHLLLFVEQPTDEILGRIIARFKTAVNREAGIESVFSKGFNDQILKPSRSLDALYRYLRDNPRRLAVRRALPQYFRMVSELRIGNGVYNAYGNIQLLDNPFREQVVVHRADSDATRLHNRDLWLYTAANGGVLVSPFISPAEKAIRAEAEALGGRIVLISPEPFGERYKPALHDFQLCEEGRLLIVSCPSDRRELDRRHCLTMNSLAAAIAA